MRAKEERVNPMSCLNRAHPEEMVFTLLGRDIAAPLAIRAWAHERVRLGLNSTSDEQIKEAYDCADRMDKERNAQK